MKKYYYYLFLLLALLAGVLTYRSWLSGSIFSYSDWPYYYKESLIVNGYLTTWVGGLDLGFFGILTYWRKPVQILYRIFALYGQGKEVADIYLSFIPIIIISPLLSYVIFYKLSKSSIAAFIATLVFNFNTYFLSINTQGHLYLTISASLVLAGIYILITTDLKKDYLRIVFLSLVCYAITIHDLRNLYIFFMMMFAYIFLDLLYTAPEQLKEKIISLVRSYTLLLALTILLNSYWLLPQLQSSSLLTNAVTIRGMVLGGFFGISKSLALSHPFWNGNSVRWFTLNTVSFHLWLVPLVAFTTLIFKKNKITLYFAIISIIGVLLSKQTNYPLVSLYEYFFNTIPGFNAFREASKFYLITVIGYSLLINTLVPLLLYDKGSVKLWKKAFLLVLIATLLYNCIPYASGNVGLLTKPAYRPKDYDAFNILVRKSKNYNRTLWIPADSKWASYNNIHANSSLINLIHGNWTVYFDNKTQTTEKTITQLIKKKYFHNLLNNSSIQYIAVPTEYKLNKLESFGSRTVFISELNQLPFLRKIELNGTELVLFENSDFKPHIYTTEKKESIYNSIQANELSYDAINPSEYRISITRASKPFYLNFADAYHPDWKIRIGTFQWIYMLIHDEYFLPEANHTKSDAQLNSFYIDPESVCKAYYCKKNSDGTYDLSLTLYFKPQAYMLFGLVISVATLLTCVGYILFYFVTRRDTRHGI